MSLRSATVGVFGRFGGRRIRGRERFKLHRHVVAVRHRRRLRLGGGRFCRLLGSLLPAGRLVLLILVEIEEVALLDRTPAPISVGQLQFERLIAFDNELDIFRFAARIAQLGIVERALRNFALDRAAVRALARLYGSGIQFAITCVTSSHSHSRLSRFMRGPHIDRKSILIEQFAERMDGHKKARKDAKNGNRMIGKCCAVLKSLER